MPLGMLFLGQLHLPACKLPPSARQRHYEFAGVHYFRPAPRDCYVEVMRKRPCHLALPSRSVYQWRE